MQYYQFRFHIVPDTADARALLTDSAAQAGFESFDEPDGVLTGWVQTDLLDEGALREAIADFPLPGVQITYDKMLAEDRDWNEVWEQEGFEPITIGDRLLVYDAKNHKQDEYEAPLKIGIEAKNAFGSGTHETTQMVLERLCQLDLKGKRVLDCGCGTGILGIVAARLGAAEVVGYDIDEWSVRNTQHNAELNGVNIETCEGDVRVLSHVSGLFDVVMANINRNILLNDMPQLRTVMAADCTLIISGFYEQDVPRLQATAAGLGLKQTARSSRGEWQCLEFRVKSEG